MKKRILSMALCLCMALTLLPITALAAVTIATDTGNPMYTLSYNSGSSGIYSFLTPTIGGTAGITVSESQLSTVVSSARETGLVTVDVSALPSVTGARLPAKLVKAASESAGAGGLRVSLPTGSVTLDKTAARRSPCRAAMTPLQAAWRSPPPISPGTGSSPSPSPTCPRTPGRTPPSPGRITKGIADGTSDSAFTPGRTCTRAQVVTFLYRCLGR